MGLEAGINNPLDLSAMKFGVVADYQIHRFLSIHPEFFFIEKETPFDLESFAPEEDFRLNQIDYLEFPIALQLKVKLNVVSFNLFLGPFIAYGLSASALDFQTGTLSHFSLQEINVSRIDFGALIGGGLDFDIAKGRRMFIDVRFNIGLKDINTTVDGETYTENNSLTMGIMFPLKFKKKEERQTENGER